MSFYGFKGRVEPVETNAVPSLNCPNVDYNCCTPDDEELARSLWETQNKHRIEKYYEVLLYSLKYVLGFAVEVERVAKKVKANPNFGSRNCNAYADDYLTLNINTELIKEIFFSIVEGLEDIAGLRKGFYCNICDAQTQQDIHYHRFNPLVSNSFLMNQDFCRQYVSGTIQAAYFQTFYVKPYLEKATDLMSCVLNQEKNLKYDIGYFQEKTVKNCYYFQQKYFFYFCESYCENFSMIKTTSIIEGDMTQLRPFVMFFHDSKDALFDDPENNVLMGRVTYEDEFITENIGSFSKEVIFFPPMTDAVDMKEFLVDVDLEDGVNPYYSAKGAKFTIYLANVNLWNLVIISVISLTFLI